MQFSTKAIHAGQMPDQSTGAVVIPIYQTSTFAYTDVGKHQGYEYSRYNNPTRAALEQCLAALEEARHCLTFSSGVAAEDAVLSTLRPGDHVVTAENIYGGTFRLFHDVYTPRQVNFTYVDADDVSAFDQAIHSQTKLVWVETPANPRLQLVDIQAVGQVCRSRGVPLVVDNTFATPYFQQPLTLNADVVVHSMTKYIGGHSDVLGGAVLTNDSQLHNQFRFHQINVGAIPGPFDCWLCLRGLKTLAIRMNQHERNARAMAEFLAGHPRVAKTYYPGLPNHPQHELAKRQMKGFGAIVTFELGGGLEQAKKFLKHLKLFTFAPSLGGVESLVCHPVSMSHSTMTPEARARIGITEGVIRLSVGIEDIRDLVDDVDRALSASV